MERYLGYRSTGLEPGTHRGLPGRLLTFIVSLGYPVEITSMPDPRAPAASLQAFVGGLHDAPATIAHDGRQYGISLDVTPLGARALFGLPAGELGRLVVPLGVLLGRGADRLVDRLASADSWPERFAILDEELLARVSRLRSLPRPEVVRAWDRVVTTGGRVSEAELADEVGWSRRHLTDRFRAEFGLAPKVAGRVVRFERARRLLQRPERPALATVAASTGYFDQAHPHQGVPRPRRVLARHVGGRGAPVRTRRDHPCPRNLTA